MLPQFLKKLLLVFWNVRISEAEADLSKKSSAFGPILLLSASWDLLGPSSAALSPLSLVARGCDLSRRIHGGLWSGHMEGRGAVRAWVGGFLSWDAEQNDEPSGQSHVGL